ncbi:sigma-70 family RNA polymerase sigma factor [Streptomyces sp. NPDC002935]|uniref:RNA polymerase sigma factor n=1 Tax=Streptomyces sp. NPDC002935 TaxID=3154545 RepID=UPI00339DEFDD
MNPRPDFGEFFEAYYGRALRFVRRHGFPVAEAEDVIAETFTALLVRWQSHGEPEQPAAYLYRSLSNQMARRHAKRDQQAFSQALDETIDVIDARQLEAFDRVETMHDAWRLLCALPERQRAIFYMRFFLDMSGREIAQQLGLAPGSVSKHLFMARKRLAERLQEEQDFSRADHLD